LLRLAAPLEALFVGDASQARQVRRLGLVREAIVRVWRRADREVETAAALAVAREERRQRLAVWRVRRDEMAAERKREQEASGGE